MNFTSKKNLKIFIFVLVAVITLGVGYAAITAITLNINGGGSASAVQENFNVHFTGTPSITKNMGSATIDENNNTIANLKVTGLSKKGDTAQAIYTVINESNGVGAEIKLGLTNSNTEYFKVTEKINDTELQAGETTLVTITVELTKTPIEDRITTTIQGILEASPIDNELVSKGKNATIVNPKPYVYSVNSTYFHINREIPNGVTTYTKFSDAKTAFSDRPAAVAHILNNGTIAESYLAFEINGQIYYLRGGINEHALSNKTIYDTNRSVLLNAFESNLCEEIIATQYNAVIYRCISNGIDYYAWDNGDVYTFGDGWRCDVNPGGYSNCSSY